MKKLFHFIKNLLRVGILSYIGLFIVFFFDLDGKVLFYKVEPFLAKHYDEMKRKDPLSQKYDIEKPDYEYDIK